MEHNQEVIKAAAPDRDTMTMSERRKFTVAIATFFDRYAHLFSAEELHEYRTMLRSALRGPASAHDSKGLCKALMSANTALLFADTIEPDHNILCAIGLYPLLRDEYTDIISIRKFWGEDVAGLLTGISSVRKFSGRRSNITDENFRGLLVTLADDIRVIIMMIVSNLQLMRSINMHPDHEWVRSVAFEAGYLYAQLAHRLGLYKIKGELEDLSLKYTNREIYTSIARKLNETKSSRDAYIASFIGPLRQKLTEAGLKFEIKGRTKSISSIWGKMKKQKVDIQGIYDLFAIRVIIDTPPEKEKADCWLAYSILADMFTANPARMRDWISIPKSNGYESLLATVMGPGQKWVEVQFRTRRMDLVAEKGLAAHWRYKGVKSDSTDLWMNNIRDILEAGKAGPMQLMKDIRPEDSEREVYAFTPKGDLFRLCAGATVLDFAFHIHSNVGIHCIGARINGRHRKINHRIESGDTVEIITSPSQSPKQSWLNIVKSSKARNKIRQSLNEETLRMAALGKEAFERRARNRKLDIDEARLMKIIRHLGYRQANEFFAALGEEKEDMGRFLSLYQDSVSASDEAVRISAEEFRLHRDEPDTKESDDIIRIGGKTISGISLKYAKCCNPVFGDKVFGFISSDGAVKIHKEDCPNAANIRSRYPYRIVRTEWSGQSGESHFSVNLRVIGSDDLGIVTQITSIISKELGVDLRNIRVDSNDGIFAGLLTVNVRDLPQLSTLMKKLSGVKGVKSVERL